MAPSSRNNNARTQLKPRTSLVPGSALYSWDDSHLHQSTSNAPINVKPEGGGGGGRG